MVSKRCRICGEYKPIEEFYKNHTHKDGHGNECRVCNNQKTMEAARRRRAAKKAAKEDSRKAEEPAAYAPVQETTAAKPSLSHFTDRELADELHARGWSGTLSKNLSVS